MLTRPFAALAAGACGAAALAATVAPALAGAAPLKPPPAVWAGTWSTNKGPLTITASGPAATGVYGYADSTNDPISNFTARVNGATLSGEWHESPAVHAPLDKGTFTLTWSFVNGQARFTGPYAWSANGTTVDWQGSCKAGPCAVDVTKPVVKALASTGTAGSQVVLRYVVADERARAAVTVAVLRGSTVLWRKSVPMTGVPADDAASQAVAWNAPKKVKGPLRFTVTARDGGGNTATSSAVLKLS